MITERDKSIDTRDEFGHWEMDTVYSGKKKSKSCLLVFTERKTRYELIYKMKSRCADEVVKVLNKMERYYGKNTFRDIFRTITCDNGIEFSDIDGIMKNDRTKLFFCHAYTSCERGSNENQNKLIRRFIKKGMDISKFSNKEINNIEDWINTLPRKLFDGKSSYEVLTELRIAL